MKEHGWDKRRDVKHNREKILQRTRQSIVNNDLASESVLHALYNSFND